MTSKEIKKQRQEQNSEDLSEARSLVLHNDDIHSFEYVTDALIEICDHNYEQALQCALITHNKGKCDIKKGWLQTLRAMRTALLERELNVTID
ncbi:MAG: Clp protease ClpS [Draconibacterium sp.]|nr:MAG: Clp protease ClpS [Draconibacterium sp.]